jgi:uncharacterized protein (TIGR02231 family)
MRFRHANRHDPHARRETILVATLALLAASGPAAGASTIAVGDAPIVEVTVYPDRAEIVREATVALPAGDSSIEFVGIPFRVEPDSLRVSAEGVPSTLGAVEIRDRVEEPAETPEWIAARDAVRDLERQLATLDVEDKNARKLRGFLDAVSTVTAQNQTRDMAEGRADPEAIRGVYELLRSEHGALSAGELEREQRRVKLKEDLEVARAKLATLRPAGSIHSRVATVEVDAERAGSLSLRLAYLVAGASWRPAYRASLDPDAGRVHLVSEAVVRQTTGEDWSGVDLHLSTAAPARGVEPPMLGSWLLRPQVWADSESDLGGFAREESKAAPAPSRIYQNVISMEPEAQDAAEAMAAEAAVVHSAFNVAFAVPGRSDVPSDESDHRVTLRQEDLDAELIYRTVPGLNTSAYLTAKTHAPKEYPLLAGPVRVFAGGAYLGAFRAEETGPGAELTIPFGADNRIKVIRVKLPRESGREGFAGKYRQVAFGYRTVVENLMSRKVSLILEDRVPVSEDERIVVEIAKETTEGYKKSDRRPGVMLWQMELEPRAKQEVVLEYSVRFPRDLVVAGIE